MKEPETEGWDPVTDANGINGEGVCICCGGPGPFAIDGYCGPCLGVDEDE